MMASLTAMDREGEEGIRLVVVHYCTLSLSDLWVTRQDNQNKTQMVNTKIIYNLREHRRKRETIYENTEEKSTMIV